ncbi:hypothetical protein BGZ73_000964 [Actinomortierella ambigua]|nr:hypothetical protein BGZ73_000964 [Actinomortierella ambigua]
MRVETLPFFIGCLALLSASNAEQYSIGQKDHRPLSSRLFSFSWTSNRPPTDTPSSPSSSSSSRSPSSSCTSPTLSSPILAPYTTPWVAELQTIYNTKGIFRNDTHCPTPIPPWECRPYPLSEAEYDREPKDNIKAIISMGDSISAGFAMLSGRPPLASILEYRGKVFSDGGDYGEHTLANFLRTFRYRLNGSPSGVTLPLAHGKDLNTAVSGAIVQTLPEQVDHLRRQFSWRGKYRAYRHSWKVVTLFVGANNLCAACNDPAVNKQIYGDSNIADPENYREALRKILKDLKPALGGKAFVNLVGIFDVTLVYDQSRGYPYCEMLLDLMPIPICGCASKDDEHRKKAGQLAREYNIIMQELADEINQGEEGRDGQFAVVYQPGLTEFKRGAAGYGQGFLSGLDCFHPNKCANQLMAISLWNNMFSPADDKNAPSDPENAYIYCPGPNDYLQ